ncbi:MAG: stage III sporulation protein AE [Oscillospiraceae bacterium]|nr:stage III sporulation protein AE [Oscillospiraceae bacterium]
MRRILICLALTLMLSQPVFGVSIEPPIAPHSAQEYMPDEIDSFGDDLWYIITSAFSVLTPSVNEAARICVALVGITLLVSLSDHFGDSVKRVSDIIGALSMGMLLLKPVNTLLNLGIETVKQIADYGKLLLPVMTAAMAAQGSITASGALYVGTAFFSALLSSLVTTIIVPMIYVFVCLSIANCALGDKMLQSLRDFSKWSMTWALKMILYIFTGYMGITGVVSGTADAAAVKATKLAISGSVPVVGSILSDASEAILVSAGVMKSAAGVYGILTVIAIFIGPFLRIGVQYLVLKFTSAICGAFGSKRPVELINSFSGAMGLILGMTGTVCLLQLISTVCFMKGVG